MDPVGSCLPEERIRAINGHLSPELEVLLISQSAPDAPWRVVVRSAGRNFIFYMESATGSEEALADAVEFAWDSHRQLLQR